MSASARHARTTIWHEVECGAYTADLPAFAELAKAAAGPVLELGAGTGRVSIELARRGYDVTALDHDGELLEALEERAGAAGVAVRTVHADARRFSLVERFGLVIAPMQLIQVIAPADRGRALALVAEHLGPGGCAAFAILAPDAEGAAGSPAGSAPPLPDVREIDGWIYSSLPVAVEPTPEGIEVTRLRQTVAPDGALDEETERIRLHRLSAERLEREAAGVGLEPRERIEIAPTADHVGSTIVVCEGSR